MVQLVTGYSQSLMNFAFHLVENFKRFFCAFTKIAVTLKPQ